MKKTLLILTLSILSFGFLSAQMLNDFDANQNITMEGWPNIPAVVSNPYNGGINTSANCASFQRGTEQWAHAFSILATPIDFSANNTFNLKVWSPIACTILFKLENQTGTATPVENFKDITVENDWTQLSFNFAGASSNVYDKIVIFFDFATLTDNLFYFDDLEFTVGADLLDLPVTFDDPTVVYSLTDFGSASSVIGADPVVSSNNCAITTKTVGAAEWAGTTIGTGDGFMTVMPFSATNTKMSARVYSPAAGIPVRMKVENHNDPTQTCETEVLTTMANAWETIEFNFSNEAPGTATLNFAWTFDMASIFFDFASLGNGDVYYWDDVEFIGGGGSTSTQIDLPVTFESTTIDYTLTDFGGNGSVLGVDPVSSSNTVAITTKPSVAETWAGTTIGTPDGFASVIPFSSTEKTMSLRVYSPAAGIPILLKVEESANSGISCETLMSTTLANTWETLVFDFENEAAGTPALDLSMNYNKASIFFDFGNNGSEATFYWDDVTFGGTISVSELNESEFNIYPNPVINVLSITGNQNISKVTVFNTLGSLVLSTEVSNQKDLELDFSNIENGLYLINIHDNNNQITTRKFLKK